MYKEQEKLKTLKTHTEVHEAYSRLISTLPTYGTVFFPVRVSFRTVSECVLNSVKCPGN